MKKRVNQKNNIENLKKILKIATIIFLSTSPIFDCIFFHSRITTLTNKNEKIQSDIDMLVKENQNLQSQLDLET